MIKMMLKDWLLRAIFLETLFLSAATPQTRIQIMQAVNPNLVAIRFLVSHIAVIIFTIIYDKYSDKFYRCYPILMSLRLIANVMIIGMVIIDQMNMTSYFIYDLTISALLGRSISCCSARMRRYVYNSQQREKFDNYKHLGAAIAGIAGNSIALLGIPVVISWALLMLSVIVDTLCSLMQYYSISKKL